MRHEPKKCEIKYLYPDCSLKQIDLCNTTHDFTIFGHTHHPFMHIGHKTQIINPGSVGQPRDYGSLASYAIVNTKNNVVVFRRVPFKTEKIVQAVKNRDPKVPKIWEVFRREYI